jgi:hypothetical protein
MAPCISSIAYLYFIQVATIPEDNMQRNVDFLTYQTGYPMARRPIEVVQLDESLINNGDFFGVCHGLVIASGMY